METKIGDIIELTPTKWVDNGHTIAFSSNKTVFCIGGSPGKKDKFIVEKSNKKILFVRIHKVDSDCSAFPICGGCAYRHISYEEELDIKYQQMVDSLEFDESVVPGLAYGNPIGYRNNVQWKRKGDSIGFYERYSHRIIDLKNLGCKNLNPHLLIQNLKRDDPLEWRISEDIHSLAVPYFQKETIFRYSNLQFRIPSKGFMQTNSNMTKIWLDEIIDWTRDFYKIKGKLNCLELYCGSGIIGQVLHPFVSTFLGVEGSSESVEYAKLNSTNNHLTTYTYLKRDLYRKALDGWGGKIDLLLANPPREGLGPPVIDWVKINQPSNIIYSSCDIKTLSRDLKNLSKYLPNYKISKVKLFDFFPRTKHFETLTQIVKKDFQDQKS